MPKRPTNPIARVIMLKVERKKCVKTTPGYLKSFLYVHLISDGINLAHFYAFSPWNSREGCPTCGSWATSVVYGSATAEEQPVHRTGVPKLSRFLGYERKSGRAVNAGLPNPHPLGSSMNLTRAVYLGCETWQEFLPSLPPQAPYFSPPCKDFGMRLIESGR